jgi:signal peptidase I
MGNFLKTLLWIAALLAVVAGAARLTVLRWWQVPSDDPILEASIEPTLHGGDWVLLWRATPPHFGSLVVCPEPGNEDRGVIGRIVGEEGDKLTIEGTNIQLNDHDALTEGACNERTFRIADPNTGSDVEQGCSLEALGGVLHMRGDLNGRQQVLQKTTRTVGEGKTYLVSDNRAYPYDSRNYGSVDRATCKESVFFRLVSKEGFADVKNRFTYIR